MTGWIKLESGDKKRASLAPGVDSLLFPSEALSVLQPRLFSLHTPLAICGSYP